MSERANLEYLSNTPAPATRFDSLARSLVDWVAKLGSEWTGLQAIIIFTRTVYVDEGIYYPAPTHDQPFFETETHQAQ